jgi:hypothetical protein
MDCGEEGKGGLGCGFLSVHMRSTVVTNAQPGSSTYCFVFGWSLANSLMYSSPRTNLFHL